MTYRWSRVKYRYTAMTVSFWNLDWRLIFVSPQTCYKTKKKNIKLKRFKAKNYDRVDSAGDAVARAACPVRTTLWLYTRRITSISSSRPSSSYFSSFFSSTQNYLKVVCALRPANYYTVYSYTQNTRTRVLREHTSVRGMIASGIRICTCTCTLHEHASTSS